MHAFQVEHTEETFGSFAHMLGGQGDSQGGHPRIDESCLVQQVSESRRKDGKRIRCVTDIGEIMSKVIFLP